MQETTENILLAGSAAILLYGVYKWNHRNDMTPEETEQFLGRVSANNPTITTGTVQVKTAEASGLNSNYGVLRKTDSDGTLTTYRYIPESLTPYQRSLIETGSWDIKDGVLKAKTFPQPSLLGVLFPPLGAYQIIKGLF